MPGSERPVPIRRAPDVASNIGLTCCTLSSAALIQGMPRYGQPTCLLFPLLAKLSLSWGGLVSIGRPTVVPTPRPTVSTSYTLEEIKGLCMRSLKRLQIRASDCRGQSREIYLRAGAVALRQTLHRRRHHRTSRKVEGERLGKVKKKTR